MLSTNALIRRYTPPTCTLEIWGKRSPLSLWAGRNLLKDVGFQLYLDDPRQTEREPLVIKGSSYQLQSLCDVVSNYTQNLLQFRENMTSPIQELTQHQLSLDSLALSTPPETLNLSITQLFDLANALDEYSQESAVLPKLDKSLPRKALLTWSATAAALILAFGLPLGVRYWQQTQLARIAKNTLPPVPRNVNPESLEIPSVPLPPAPLPSPTLPPTISDIKPLPPPGGIQPLPSPARNPNIAITVPPPPVLPPPPGISPAPTAIVIAPLPPVPAQGGTTRAPAELAPGTVNLNPPLPTLPKLPSLQAPKSETTNLPNADQRAKVTQPSLLDTIPQVAEVRQYFQARWQPPESLKQTLEYRLTLSKDGSLERITPLGQAAKIYLDRTAMPLLGEPFVSELEPSLQQNPEIRLVLSPDRTVRTFMEQP